MVPRQQTLQLQLVAVAMGVVALASPAQAELRAHLVAASKVCALLDLERETERLQRLLVFDDGRRQIDALCGEKYRRYQAQKAQRHNPNPGAVELLRGDFLRCANGWLASPQARSNAEIQASGIRDVDHYQSDYARRAGELKQPLAAGDPRPQIEARLAEGRRQMKEVLDTPFATVTGRGALVGRDGRWIPVQELWMQERTTVRLGDRIKTGDDRGPPVDRARIEFFDLSVLNIGPATIIDIREHMISTRDDLARCEDGYMSAKTVVELIHGALRAIMRDFSGGWLLGRTVTVHTGSSVCSFGEGDVEVFYDRQRDWAQIRVHRGKVTVAAPRGTVVLSAYQVVEVIGGQPGPIQPLNQPPEIGGAGAGRGGPPL